MNDFRPSTENLQAIVTELATPDGRMVGTTGHEAARQNLLERIQAAGLEGYHDRGHELAYEAFGSSFTNLFGVGPWLEPRPGSHRARRSLRHLRHPARRG